MAKRISTKKAPENKASMTHGKRTKDKADTVEQLAYRFEGLPTKEQIRIFKKVSFVKLDVA